MKSLGKLVYFILKSIFIASGIFGLIIIASIVVVFYVNESNNKIFAKNCIENDGIPRILYYYGPVCLPIDFTKIKKA